jgi:hypothetical protein
MKKRILILTIAVSLLHLGLRAQINEGGTYQNFTCKGRTENYVYYGGTKNCPVTWTVIGGVFPDHGNATSAGAYTYTDNDLGIST